MVLDFITKHWEGLASLLLSAVSIWIAIYSARSTSKDAARQIASVKELGEIQAEASLLAIDLELQKVVARLYAAQEESKNIKERIPRIAVMNLTQRDRFGNNGKYSAELTYLKAKDLELDGEIKYLTELQNRLSNIRERMQKNKEEGKV